MTRAGTSADRRLAAWALVAVGAVGPVALPADDLARWVDDLGGADVVRQEAARRHLFVRPGAIDALCAGIEELDARPLAARLSLLAALAPDRAQRFAVAAGSHGHPAVRAAAADAISRGELAAAELAPVIALLLADPDASVAAALLDGLAARTLPVRGRFAARVGDELGKLLARGDPRLRRRALELLVLDDAPAAGVQAWRLLERLADDERTLLLAAIADRPPQWDATRLVEFEHAAATAATAIVDEEPTRRLLARRLFARFDPEARVAIDDDLLLDLMRHAVRPQSEAQEHAAAALAALGPAIAPRLLILLPELADDEFYEGAIELALRLRGAAGIDELIERIVAPETKAATAAPILAVLARLRCEAMARRLDEKVAPRCATALRPLLAEAAMRMPPCEPRNRLLLNALRDLSGERRLRPFEALARTGESALLGFLLDALDAERGERVRGRMIEQIAESFGASDPDDVLAMVRAQFDGPRESDRIAALEAIPFVALGRQADAVAEELARRFASSATEPLLHVLGQIGGDVAEQTFRELARRLAPDATEEERWRFLLSRAGRLRGEPTRELLIAALDDPRPRPRETALRALIERGDPVALERAPALLASLESGARAPLAADLGGLRHLRGYSDLVRRLLAESEEEATRLALLELAEPSLREVLLPTTLALLAATNDPDERHAALEALGRLGGEEANALLKRRVAAALELPDERFDESDATFAEGRTALLSLAAADPAGSASPAATMLLRIEAARADLRVERAAFGLPAQPPLADPALLELLSSRPAAESLPALQAAWLALGLEADLCDERFFSGCAEAAAVGGAPRELCEWFDDRVLELWPPDSAADLRALLPPGPRRELLHAAAAGEADASLLADVPRIVAALARGAPTARDRLAAAGRSDPLLGVAPSRTLAALALLAEGAALDRVAREAIDCPPLLRSVAALAARRAVELDPALRERAARPAASDPELAELRRALEASRR